MAKCVFCGKIYENPRGLTLVMNSGVINYLCSGKCRKNFFMKRRKVRWVKKMKGKDELVFEEKEETDKLPTGGKGKKK